MRPIGDAFLDAGVRGYIINTARANYWRVSSYYEFEDLVQDGLMVYCKIRNRYAATVVNQANFMALFKTAYFNHISTLAAKNRAVPECSFSDLARTGDEETVEFSPDNVLPPQPEMGTLVALVASAPAEIKQLLQTLANDGFNVLKFERKRTGRRRSVRETNNEFYCRLLGKNPREDIVGLVKGYFA